MVEAVRDHWLIVRTLVALVVTFIVLRYAGR